MSYLTQPKWPVHCLESKDGMAVTEDDVRDLHKRIHEMSDAELEGLDPVCEALAQIMRKDLKNRGGYCGPNRAIALACVDLAWCWNDVMMSQK